MRRVNAVAQRCRALVLLLALLAIAAAVRAAVAPSPARLPAAGLLLVASEGMRDPRFAQTVLLVLEADEGGAVALVLNRPLRARLDEAIPNLPPRAAEVALYSGGPVRPGQVTVLTRTTEEAAGMAPVLDGVKVTLALTALQALMRGVPPVQEIRAYLGYAGWSPGQLERELARGDWHLLSTDAGEIFDTPPAEMWPRLQRRATGMWVLRTPRSQPPSRSTSTPESSPSVSTSTRTRIGWQHTEQSST